MAARCTAMRSNFARKSGCLETNALTSCCSTVRKQAVVDGGDVSSPHAPGQERHLSEEVPGTEVNSLPPNDHFDRARGNEEHLGPHLAGANDALGLQAELWRLDFAPHQFTFERRESRRT
jgi:hypothetical protein